MSASANHQVLNAFVRARWLAVTLRSRRSLRAHQDQGLSHWRDHVRESFPHHDPDTLTMSKPALMANFSAYNQER